MNESVNNQSKAGLELSIVIPTFNESENIVVLLDRLVEVLAPLNFEVIVVDDDSPDLTWKFVESYAANNERVRVIRRMDAKGLSSAVTTGMLQANGACIAVMDADLQHDETILPQMARKVLEEGFDVAVGSREAPGGSYGEWSISRKLTSYGAKWLAKLAVGSVAKDPMSGFFAISRDWYLNTVDLVNPSGFKILLEFLVRGDKPNVVEIGYGFRQRERGETKLNSTVMLEYLLALVDLRFGWLIPNQFVKFAAVGITGSLVNFSGFAFAQAIGISIPLAVVIGVELAIVWTYFCNNYFTFTPMTFRGRDLLKGFIIYQLVACYGLVVQLSVVEMLLGRYPALAGGLLTLYLTYMVGVLFAAFGNFMLHTHYTWNRIGMPLYRANRRQQNTKPLSIESNS